jgi:RNA polymerase sigma-70 factor (ECF subfamily)
VGGALRIVRWPPDGDADGDERLVRGVRAGEAGAMAALIDRHGTHVRRVLLRVLGQGDSEHGDLVQEVFTRAWQGIGRLETAGALKAWLTRIAVFVARGAIRRRRRKKWLSFFHEVPEPEVTAASPDVQEAAACVYRILDRLPVDERIPFTLKMLDGMDLESTAAACGMSVATVRRRLARAERRFFRLARQCEALAPWLEEA